MNGLIIKPEFVDLILSGSKIWELRSRATNIRGEIALIKSGSGEICGVCDLINVLGPFRPDEFSNTEDKTGIAQVESVLRSLNYERAYAWVLDNVRVLKNPKPYDHPAGAITWVRLPDNFLARKLALPVNRVAEVFSNEGGAAC